jgi:hypothetical protein
MLRLLQTHSEKPNTGLSARVSPQFGNNLSQGAIQPSIAGMIQRRPTINKPGIVPYALRSSGEPLDPSTRDLMGRRFGHDFGEVRVHADEAAAQSARDVNARAYTIGHDIVFGAGQFAPATPRGRLLLAHELAHVVQQREAAGEQPGAAHEREADSAARAVHRDSLAVVRKGSARGVPQFGPNEDLDELLKRGPALEPPTPEEQKAAVGRLNAGTATTADREVLLRRTIVESRAYLQAEAGRPLNYKTLTNCCGPGRDVSAASFGALASGSPKPITIARFQSLEVFGVNKHGFNVVTFADGTQYLVDPTFAQFFHPATEKDPQKRTAQVLRGDPNGTKMALDLMRNGFVELTRDNARFYARALGVGEADADRVAENLFTGKKAAFVEQVGMGRKTAFKLGRGGPDVLDRSELKRFLQKEHIPNVRKAGDPYKLLPQLQQLVQELEEPKPSLAPVHPPASTVSGQLPTSKGQTVTPSTQRPSLAPTHPPAKTVSGVVGEPGPAVTSSGGTSVKLTGDPTAAAKGLRFRIGSIGRGGLQIGVGAGIAFLLNWLYSEGMKMVQEPFVKNAWEKKIMPKAESDLKKFFREEGDLAYWADWALHSKPLGKFYVHVMVHVKEMTQTTAVDGHPVTMTTFAGMDYIGISVGTDPQDYASDRPFESHMEMGVQVETNVVITSLPLVDMADLVRQEVLEIQGELSRISVEWARLSGLAQPTLVDAASRLTAAVVHIAYRQQKPAGDRLREALQALAAIPGSSAVKDQRLKSLAGQIDTLTERLNQVIRLFK